MTSLKNGQGDSANPDDGTGTEFRDLIQQVSEGSEDAALKIIETHGKAIFRAIRRSLDSQMRQRFDSGDFAQLVWKSFFCKPAGMDRFSTPEEMTAFLMGMARNKVKIEVRRSLVRPASNMNREQYLDDSHNDIADKLRTSDPRPVDVAIGKECYDQLMQDKSGRNRKIIQMKIDEHKLHDIASESGVNERTVRRVLKRLCEEIEQ